MVTSSGRFASTKKKSDLHVRCVCWFELQGRQTDSRKMPVKSRAQGSGGICMSKVAEKRLLSLLMDELCSFYAIRLVPVTTDIDQSSNNPEIQVDDRH